MILKIYCNKIQHIKKGKIKKNIIKIREKNKKNNKINNKLIILISNLKKVRIIIHKYLMQWKMI